MDLPNDVQRCRASVLSTNLPRLSPSCTRPSGGRWQREPGDVGGNPVTGSESRASKRAGELQQASGRLGCVRARTGPVAAFRFLVLLGCCCSAWPPGGRGAYCLGPVGMHASRAERSRDGQGPERRARRTAASGRAKLEEARIDDVRGNCGILEFVWLGRRLLSQHDSHWLERPAWDVRPGAADQERAVARARARPAVGGLLVAGPGDCAVPPCEGWRTLRVRRAEGV